MYPKKNIFILFTLYFATSSLFAQQNSNQPAAFSQNIIYSAPIVHGRIEDVRKEWWYSRLEAITHYRFMSPLLNRIIKRGESTKEASIEYYDVDAFRFNEAWYFDKTKMIFYKKVNGLYLVKRESKNSEQGWMYDYRPLVYIPMK